MMPTAAGYALHYRNDDVMRAGQVAKLFGIAPRTVAKLMERGDLKGYRIDVGGGKGDGDRRFHRRDVLAYAHAKGIRHAVEALGGGKVHGYGPPKLRKSLPDVGWVDHWLDLPALLPSAVLLDLALMPRPCAVELAKRLQGKGCRVVALVYEDEASHGDGPWDAAVPHDAGAEKAWWELTRMAER